MKQWDEFHKKREQAMGTEPPHSAVAELFKTLKDNNCKRVLDHGCGTGRNFFYLQKNGFEVYGVDSSGFALDSLRQQGASSDRIIKGDIAKLPFNDNFFDALISINVIAHGKINQIKSGINEVKRVVKPRGIILLVVPSVFFLEQQRTPKTKEVEKGTYINVDMPDHDMLHHFFTTEEMETFFKGCHILTNKYINEYSDYMKKEVNHIIFVCKNGGK